MPLLLNAWTQKRTGRLDYWLFMLALVASLLGVFMGASRSWAGIMILAFGSTFFMGQMNVRVLLGSIALAVCVGLIVANNPRLQRFTTLQDTEMVENRFATSVNESFVAALHDYPMGNGLGGGGTSIPYFLQDRVKDTVVMENEYGRILLETGIPGLLIWLIFIFWAIAHGIPDGEWGLALRLTRNLLALSFATAVLGTGLLTWVPGTPMLLAFLGWTTTAGARAPAASRVAQPQVSPAAFATNRR
jgi:cell division protein FtsW (lipid II flippase)